MKKIFSIVRNKGLVIFLGLVLLFIGLKFLKTKDPLEQGIQPPLATADIPFEEFQIMAEVDTTIYTKSGSAFHFSKNSLLYPDGRQATGTIKIFTREFHDALDIMRAGIPMRTRRDKKEILASAGMVEIHAFKDTSELKLRDAASMETDLAAYRSSVDYQLFYLKENKEWEKTDTFFTKPNLAKQKKLLALTKKIRQALGVTKKSPIDFELFSDLDMAPEMQPLLGRVWRIDAKDINDEVLRSLRINWDSVSIKKQKGDQNVYKLYFSKKQYSDQVTDNDKWLHFSVKARPLPSNKNQSFTKNKGQNAEINVDSLLKEVESEIVRVKKEADYLNSFKMRQLGVWNVDKLMKIGEFIPVIAKFDFQKIYGEKRIKIFCLYEETNSTVEFNTDIDKEIYLRTDKPMKIISFLPDNQVAIVDFNQIKNKLSQKSSPVFFATTRISETEFLGNRP
jgi:hypothetical protein